MCYVSQISNFLWKIRKGQNLATVKKSLTNIFGCEGVLTQNIFEELCVDDSFDVGDAFIFNKFVNINHGDELRESEFCGVII